MGRAVPAPSVTGVDCTHMPRHEEKCARLRGIGAQRHPETSGSDAHTAKSPPLAPISPQHPPPTPQHHRKNEVVRDLHLKALNSSPADGWSIDIITRHYSEVHTITKSELAQGVFPSASPIFSGTHPRWSTVVHRRSVIPVNSKVFLGYGGDPSRPFLSDGDPVCPQLRLDSHASKFQSLVTIVSRISAAASMSPCRA